MKPCPDCCFLWQHRGRDEWSLRKEGRGKREREGGMLFYAESRGGLTALATTSVVNQRRERSRQPRLAWDLLMDQYGLRERKGDHVIGLQLITSLRCFPPASNRGGGRMDDGVTTPRVGLTASHKYFIQRWAIRLIGLRFLLFH